MTPIDDPFALLGLPRQFAIDRPALQTAFLKRSAALHPDRLSDPIHKAEAAREIAAINDARAILLDDERRANALLQLMGGARSDQDKSLPEGFLMDIMDMRQDMDAALASGDHEQRRRIEEWAQSQRHEFIGQVAGLFNQAASSPDVRRQIRQHLNAWRYIERMIEQLDPDYRPVL